MSYYEVASLCTGIIGQLACGGNSTVLNTCAYTHTTENMPCLPTPSLYPFNRLCSKTGKKLIHWPTHEVGLFIFPATQCPYFSGIASWKQQQQNHSLSKFAFFYNVKKD